MRLLSASALGVVAAVVVPAFLAPAAHACGGLFCSGASPSPVDQNAERILFEVHDDGSVTSTVEIKYTGDPRAFSWIVPVPAAPHEVGVATPSLLNLLDTLTRPTIIPPPTTCSSSDGFFPAPSAGAVDDADAGGNGGVTVTTYPAVGPFDGIISVGGGTPDELIAFLNDNGYLITDAMRPYIAEYTLEGAQFLAVKLAPGADVTDIVPIRFQCPAENPTIPIRLTAMAAEPEMSVIAFVAAKQRYEPSGWSEVTVDEDAMRFDVFTAQSNYFPLVSQTIDGVGGRGFVVERAGASQSTIDQIDFAFLGSEDEQQAKDDLRAVLTAAPYLTRLYTRVSPEEMTDDPFFRPSNLGDVDGVYDLSNQPAVDVCAPTQPDVVPPCGTTYCGSGGACAVDAAGNEGCACESGDVARAIADPNGASTVTCQSQATQVLADVAALDACSGVSCGSGACTLMNGVPTCACDDGNVAILDAQSRAGLRCVQLQERLPDNVVWPPVQSPERPWFACTSMNGEGSALFALVAIALRRRRRAHA